MALKFRPVVAEGVSQISYIIGDSSPGTAAVVDPRPDVDVYLDACRELGLAITHVFETHIHADFMSGARELADRAGCPVFASAEGDADYKFEHEKVRDGDEFEFGETMLIARHTPGHTPEHISFLLAQADKKDDPWGVLSGDSLFVGSVGRPDLLGDKESDKLVEQLFETIRGFYLKLNDGVVIYPCHGPGSACGPNIADRTNSSIAYEKRTNPYLQCKDLESFKQKIESSAPPEPTHYRRLKKLNAKGPPIQNDGPVIPALSAPQFRKAIRERDTLLLDVRDMLAFGGGHIEGAINIGGQPLLSVWAGWMLDPEKRLLLVLPSDAMLEQVRAWLIRTGFVQFAGYLAGGMNAWATAGLPMRRLTQISVHELHEGDGQMQTLDVRTPEEWQKGRIPGATHVFLPELRERMDELEQDRPVAVYCGSGYRANIGASILAQSGFERVMNVPGSWSAWKKAKYPVEKEANERKSQASGNGASKPRKAKRKREKVAT